MGPSVCARRLHFIVSRCQVRDSGIDGGHAVRLPRRSSRATEGHSGQPLSLRPMQDLRSDVTTADDGNTTEPGAPRGVPRSVARILALIAIGAGLLAIHYAGEAADAAADAEILKDGVDRSRLPREEAVGIALLAASRSNPVPPEDLSSTIASSRRGPFTICSMGSSSAATGSRGSGTPTSSIARARRRSGRRRSTTRKVAPS